MAGNTVRLHRVLRAPPGRVYRAFVDAGAMAKWISPNGFTCTVHHMEARVGGTFRMSFTNFSAGNSHSFGGEYLELVPDKYGLSWQIVPAILPQLLSDGAKSDKVMQAVVKMTKLDIAALQKAAA